MKNICVVGAGYVGLVTGACFAELGNVVRCVDTDEAKVASLREGAMPIYEPGLDMLVHRNIKAGRLSATTSFLEGLEGADFVFVAVGTPNTTDGQADLSYLRSAYKMIASSLNGTRPVIVNKSTVPPGTSDMMTSMLAAMTDGMEPLSVVAHPEFLREGRAVSDFMNPARVVIGARDRLSAEAVAELHRPLGSPILITSLRSAEMIKYASNAFLALKISFVNEIAAVCDTAGVDVTEVAQGMGMDPRIGGDFLNAGIGYGGSCLPKDMSVLTRFAEKSGYSPNMLKAAIEVNSQQPKRLVGQVEELLGTLEGAHVAVLGLAFKPGTDDLRYSPAVEIVEQLLSRRAAVKACDPRACLDAHALPAGVEYFLDPYQAAQGCDAIILATEWPEYTDLDLVRLKATMRGNLLADGRNAIAIEKARQAGFAYIGLGRGVHGPALKEQEVEFPALLD